MQAVGINYWNTSKTCHHTQIDAFMTSWGCRQSKEAIQDHWLVDNSTVSAFGAYAIVTNMQAVQVGTMEQSIRWARGQARVWILLYSLHHKIRLIVQTEDSHMQYQRYYCYIVSLVTNPRINPFVDILIWSYPKAGYNHATFCLLFALLLCMILAKYNLRQIIYEIIKQHFCFTYFLNQKVICIKLSILQSNNSSVTLP